VRFRRADAAQARRKRRRRKEIVRCEESNEEAPPLRLWPRSRASRLRFPRKRHSKRRKAAFYAARRALAQISPLRSMRCRRQDERPPMSSTTFGAKRNYGFAPQQHFELGEALVRWTSKPPLKLSGRGALFVLQSGLARLERSVGQSCSIYNTGEQRLYRGQSPLLVAMTLCSDGAIAQFKDDHSRRPRGSQQGGRTVRQIY